MQDGVGRDRATAPLRPARCRRHSSGALLRGPGSGGSETPPTTAGTDAEGLRRLLEIHAVLLLGAESNKLE